MGSADGCLGAAEWAGLLMSGLIFRVFFYILSCASRILSTCFLGQGSPVWYLMLSRSMPMIILVLTRSASVSERSGECFSQMARTSAKALRAMRRKEAPAILGLGGSLSASSATDAG